MISSNSVVWCVLVLEVDSFMATCIVLDRVVINRVLPDLVHVLDWGSDDFVELPAFLLLRMQRSRHI